MKRIYTPPVVRDIPKLMSNWEKFINQNDEIDPLIKASIGHYQFEAIHPFEDGNGRTGRILMVLYLVSMGILAWPILYISGYINKNRSDYYGLLNNITKDNNWEEFIMFMIEGFYLQAMETQDLLIKIMTLFEEHKQKLRIEYKKIYTADLVEALFSFPIISPVKLGKILGIHYTTASRHLKQLAAAGILSETIYGKYHLFANKKLLSVMQKAG